MNRISENRWGDLFLQVLFVFALIILIVFFYFTRIAGSQAGDKNSDWIGDTENFVSAYQFDQEELKIEGRLKMLKADYANDVLVYQLQLSKIKNSTEYSDLEKKEKFKILTDLYSDDYFQRKEDLIEQENLKLENLKRMECAKFCTISDLSNEQK